MNFLNRLTRAGLLVGGLAFGAVPLAGQAATTFSLSSGSACGGASSATFTPGGSALTVSLCATTGAGEPFCGASIKLLAGAGQSGLFTITNRALGSALPDATTASPAYPLTIDNPASGPDLGGTPNGAAATAGGATTLLATFTIAPGASATASSYVLSSDAFTGLSTPSPDCTTPGDPVGTPTQASFTLTKLLPPTNVTFTRSPATLTFSEGGAAQTIAVSCTGTIGTPTPVTLGVAGTNNAAFTVSPPTLSFADCSAPQNVTVTPRAADAGFNAQQTGNVNITNTTVGGTVTAPAATAVTVNDNQTPAVYTVTKTTATVTEGNAATDTLTVTCAGAFTGGATSGSVAYAITGVTNPGDISAPALTGTLNFTACAGQTQSITISPRTNDTTIQGNRSGTFTISAPVAGTLGTTTTGSLSVVDDDSPQTVSIAATGSPAEQGTVPGTFTLTRSGGSSGQQAATLTANLTLAGTATFGTSCAAGVDYQLAVVGPATASLTAAPRTVTFPASTSTAAITMTPCDDTVIDAAETVILTVAAPTVSTDYTVGSPATATLTIADDDSPQVVTVTGGGALSEAAGTATFTFSRTGGSVAVQGAALVVNIGRSGTATYGASCTAGVDYTSTVTGSTLSFAGGSSSATVTITACQDSLIDPAETIIYTVAAPTAPTDYTVGSPASATATITDDDAAVNAVAGSTGAAVAASTAEGTVVRFSVSCPTLAASQTINFAITPATAYTGDVYSGSTTGSVTCPAAAASLVAVPTTVQTINDTTVGNTRVYTMTISVPAPIGASLDTLKASGPSVAATIVGNATATVTVTDDDQPVGVPTMGTLGLGLMGLLIAGFAGFQRRRVQK